MQTLPLPKLDLSRSKCMTCLIRVPLDRICGKECNDCRASRWATETTIRIPYSDR